jgi:hypothetical protein
LVSGYLLPKHQDNARHGNEIGSLFIGGIYPIWECILGSSIIPVIIIREWRADLGHLEIDDISAKSWISTNCFEEAFNRLPFCEFDGVVEMWAK